MKKFVSILALALAVASIAPATGAFARQGADDPAGHVRHGGEGAGHK